MLSIIFKTNRYIHNASHDIHTGYPVELTLSEIDSILYIQADGGELDRILREWSNLPCPSHRVIRFCGDIAKMIILNWKELIIMK